MKRVYVLMSMVLGIISDLYAQPSNDFVLMPSGLITSLNIVPKAGEFTNAGATFDQ